MEAIAAMEGMEGRGATVGDLVRARSSLPQEQGEHDGGEETVDDDVRPSIAVGSHGSGSSTRAAMPSGANAGLISRTHIIEPCEPRTTEVEECDPKGELAFLSQPGVPKYRSACPYVQMYFFQSVFTIDSSGLPSWPEWPARRRRRRRRWRRRHRRRCKHLS